MIKKIITILLLAVLQYSCIPSYSKKKAAFNKAFQNQDYIEAEKLLEKNSDEAKSKTKLLYFLNKGVVEHQMQNYEESNKSFEEAYKINDNFTSNLASDAISLFINPNISQYNGEIHEVLLIHYFKALNYIFLNDLEKALVECRRLDIKLKILRNKFEDKSKYSEDAFMHLLMGIIYQASEDYNNAFIAYRNALDTYETVYKPLFNQGPPSQLIKDLIYCAYLSGFHDQVDFYKKQHNLHDYNPREDVGVNSIIAIWHNGLGPVKEKSQIDFVILPGLGGLIHFNNEELGLAFAFPVPSTGDDLASMKLVRLAFPKYVERELSYDNASLIVNGQKFNFELCENINAISFEILRERMLWEVGKSLLRVALKQYATYAIQQQNAFLGLAASVFSYATEDADTRNWQTLPHSISYLRVKLNEIPNQVNFVSFSQKKEACEKIIDIKSNKETNTAFVEITTI